MEHTCKDCKYYSDMYTMCGITGHKGGEYRNHIYCPIRKEMGDKIWR